MGLVTLIFSSFFHEGRVESVLGKRAVQVVFLPLTIWPATIFHAEATGTSGFSEKNARSLLSEFTIRAHGIFPSPYNHHGVTFPYAPSIFAASTGIFLSRANFLLKSHDALDYAVATQSSPYFVISKFSAAAAQLVLHAFPLLSCDLLSNYCSFLMWLTIAHFDCEDRATRIYVYSTPSRPVFLVI